MRCRCSSFRWSSLGYADPAFSGPGGAACLGWTVDSRRNSAPALQRTLAPPTLPISRGRHVRLVFRTRAYVLQAPLHSLFGGSSASAVFSYIPHCTESSYPPFTRSIRFTTPYPFYWFVGTPSSSSPLPSTNHTLSDRGAANHP